MRSIMGTMLAATVLFGAVACGDDEPAAGAMEPTEVVEAVGYYYACGNETLVLPDGRMFWPLKDQQAIDRSRYLEVPAGAVAFVGRVAEPRPGDDIGTVTIWEDGTARFVSRLGTTAWLVDEEITYEWEC